MSELKEKLNLLLADLKAIDDRDLRFELLIEYAERFKEASPGLACRPFPTANKVPACESDAYVFASKSADGRICFEYAVENPQGVSAKALAVILKETLNGHSAQEIQQVDEQIVHDIFGRTISMGKGQGLMGMIRLSKQLANNI